MILVKEACPGCRLDPQSWKCLTTYVAGGQHWSKITHVLLTGRVRAPCSTGPPENRHKQETANGSQFQTKRETRHPPSLRQPGRGQIELRNSLVLTTFKTVIQEQGREVYIRAYVRMPPSPRTLEKQFLPHWRKTYFRTDRRQDPFPGGEGGGSKGSQTSHTYRLQLYFNRTNRS